jgi:hypothetical protein
MGLRKEAMRWYSWRGDIDDYAPLIKREVYDEVVLQKAIRSKYSLFADGSSSMLRWIPRKFAPGMTEDATDAMGRRGVDPTFIIASNVWTCEHTIPPRS